MLALSVLVQIAEYLIYVSIPILAIYVGYLIVTKAFNYMGFSSIEAVIIVFGSFILGAGFLDKYIGFNISSIYLFSYNNWIVGINIGGAIIPVILSIYLIIKSKLSKKHVLISVLIVSIITFFVTRPVLNKGIVSSFPYWLLPALFASLTSVFLLRKDFSKAAPLAYVSGTIGVLIGADFLHMPELLSHEIELPISAIIGGAIVFDMVFMIGILAVLLDGIILYKQKLKQGFS